MDKVLILLSSYNGEKYINEQIDSLFAQQDVFVHILVRDDGSTDNTVGLINERINKGEEITLITGSNLGFAMSFMSLVQEAYEYINDYDYYAFCDQDDVWLSDKLQAAISKLRAEGVPGVPNLYWSSFTLVDENLKPLNSIRGKEQNTTPKRVYKPVMTKPTILVRYFMLGCTMVFDKNMVEFIHRYPPKGKITMHDLWFSQTAIFFGHVIYDDNSHFLYRQHGENAAGVDSSWSGRWHRLKKSFKTYERRHFREINAKNLLNTYHDILSEEDYKLIALAANYKDSISKRMRLLCNKEINMGSKTSDLFIKARILFGLF